jgi:cell division septum initiation protein DivIVA
VAEYPDMVEENNELYDKIDQMDEDIRGYQTVVERMKVDIEQREVDQKAKEGQIKQLQ